MMSVCVCVRERDIKSQESIVVVNGGGFEVMKKKGKTADATTKSGKTTRTSLKGM